MSEEHRRHLREQIALHRQLASVYTKKRYNPGYSRLYQKHWNQVLCRVGDLPAGSLVIDFGCGTGILIRELLERGYQVVGLDLSLEMLKAHKEVIAFLVCGDGCCLPLADAKFDAVFCRGSIHHVPDLKRAFEEIVRVLKPGGYLIFSEPSNDSLINRLGRRLMYRHNDEFHIEDEGFRRRDIQKILCSLGLKLDYSRGFGFLAYALAGFPDKFGVLGKLPGNCLITRLLIRVDNALQSLPIVNLLALHWMVRARKLGETRPRSR
jgi:SAM-dependent methyltransferase